MNDTRKFLDNVLAGKSAESRTQFDGVMSQKMNAALDLRKMSLTSELFGKKVAEETLEEGTSKKDLIAQAMKWDKEAGFANEYSDFADSSIKDLKAYIKFAKGEAEDLKKLKLKRK